MIREFDSALLVTLRNARHVAVLTGAGVSAESGIPTFRDAQTGLWSRFRPEELATSEAFDRDPKLVWEWYAWRRDVVARAAPNPGHAAIARLARLVPRLTLVTQNVDGLHQRAGSSDVIELHGNIHRSRCVRENRLVDDWQDVGDVPPRCPRCGAYLRPDVVWFGEMLPAPALEQAERAAHDCDVFFCVGTSAAVYPAAQLPLTARDAGATVIEVNKDPTRISGAVTYSLRGASGDILPRLFAAAWPT
ncbi:MAG: NAD-dependent deacylase [Burkholderiales bacterium]|jgi:NAD-dependent deacetylase|nr:NAD-dependent deacylase [Burkholderiales bacterium]